MKLSEIKKSDILFRSKSSDLEKIVFEQENNILKKRCDVGVVFGGISMLPYRVDQAATLYQEGLIDKILVTGGIGFLNTDRKIPEALKMQNYLLSLGIPNSDILVEQNSRNTFENTFYSMELLQDDYNLDDINIALITSDFHIRRCLGLFSQYLNSDNLFGSGVVDGKTDIGSWKNTLYGKRLILQEAMLLCRYVKQSMIPDMEIKGLSLERKL